MQTRTLLTTPSGQTPVDDRVEPSSERYSHGFALPTEPRVPGRWRGLAGVIIVIGLLAMFAWAAFRVIADSQTFDPALDPSVPAGVDGVGPSGDSGP